jgi:hypothetical protein
MYKYRLTSYIGFHHICYPAPLLQLTTVVVSWGTIVALALRRAIVSGWWALGVAGWWSIDVDGVTVVITIAPSPEIVEAVANAVRNTPSEVAAAANSGTKKTSTKAYSVAYSSTSETSEWNDWEGQNG